MEGTPRGPDGPPVVAPGRGREDPSLTSLPLPPLKLGRCCNFRSPAFQRLTLVIYQSEWTHPTPRVKVG